MFMRNYEIFISYRRDGGSETAKHLSDTLTDKGYRVFLDIESLRSGQFNTELYRFIEQATDFILILPQNGLDRCSDPNDWVRLEIEHAKKHNKNIIPIMLKGFSFPPELPESLEFLRYQNGLEANVQYYDAFVRRLMGFLQSKRRLPQKTLWIPITIALAVAAAVLLILLLPKGNSGSGDPDAATEPTASQISDSTTVSTSSEMPDSTVNTAETGAVSPEDIVNRLEYYTNSSLADVDLARNEILSVVYEYVFAANDATRQSVYDHFDGTDYNNRIKTTYGDNARAAYTVLESTTFDEDELASVKERYTENGNFSGTDKIEEVRAVKLSVTISGSESTGTHEETRYVIKADGKWYFSIS